MRIATVISASLAAVVISILAVSVLRFEHRPIIYTKLADHGARGLVVAAARNLEPGIPLGPEDVKVIEWPGGNIPVGYAKTMEDVIGRTLLQQALMWEPIMDAKLADRGAHGVAVEIPPDMRAVTVRVDDASGVAGFILPKYRIDLMLTVGGGTPDAITKLIMQNVTVIASGTAREKDEKGHVIAVPTLTVLVSPEDVQKLKHAESQGRLTFAMRNASYQYMGVMHGDKRRHGVNALHARRQRGPFGVSSMTTPAALSS